MAPEITHLPGYKEVEDLIPGGSFIRCTEVWRLCLEYYRDDMHDLKQRLVLEMTEDRASETTDRVAVLMDRPSQISYPDSDDILGLAFEDLGKSGLEGLSWRVYDYEMSGFELHCGSLRFERRKAEGQPGLGTA